jgi:hypothetical protein
MSAGRIDGPLRQANTPEGAIRFETPLPLGTVDPGLGELGTPFDIHRIGDEARPRAV